MREEREGRGGERRANSLSENSMQISPIIITLYYLFSTLLTSQSLSDDNLGIEIEYKCLEYVQGYGRYRAETPKQRIVASNSDLSREEKKIIDLDRVTDLLEIPQIFKNERMELTVDVGVHQNPQRVAVYFAEFTVPPSDWAGIQISTDNGKRRRLQLDRSLDALSEFDKSLSEFQSSPDRDKRGWATVVNQFIRKKKNLGWVKSKPILKFLGGERDGSLILETGSFYIQRGMIPPRDRARKAGHPLFHIPYLVKEYSIRDENGSWVSATVYALSWRRAHDKKGYYEEIRYETYVGSGRGGPGKLLLVEDRTSNIFHSNFNWVERLRGLIDDDMKRT